MANLRKTTFDSDVEEFFPFSVKMSGKQGTAGSSSDSDSDFSDSEFQNLAKKRKKGLLQV